MAIQAHWFYVLYSLKDGKLYKGTCSDLGNRFLTHAMGGTTSTKHRRPLILIYTRKFESKSDALAYERYVKTIEGGIHMREILTQLGILNSSGKLCSDG
jgi:putative endonuclease